MLGRLRHPALVGGDDEQHRRHRPDAGEHRGDEPLVARDVDERDLARPRQRRPGEPEVDRHAAAALLGPPVGLHPGERPDQRRLAVVDVPGRGDDLHASTAAASVSSASGGTRAQVEQAAAVLEAAEHRRLAGAQRGRERLGQRDRGAGQRDAGRAAAADGGLGVDRFGGHAVAAQGRREPRRAGAQRGRRGVEGRRTGVAGPRRVASIAASVSLSTRSARASGCRRSRATSSAPAPGAPSSSPACGPPRSLSPDAVTSVAPRRSAVARRARRAAGGAGRAGRSRCRRPPARRGRPARRSPTERVKPVTTKFDGCTLSTKAVSGPIAAA